MHTNSSNLFQTTELYPRKQKSELSTPSSATCVPTTSSSGELLQKTTLNGSMGHTSRLCRLLSRGIPMLFRRVFPTFRNHCFLPLFSTQELNRAFPMIQILNNDGFRIKPDKTNYSNVNFSSLKLGK